MDIQNRDNKINSLQISYMGEITGGEFKLANDVFFLIKNKTDDNISLQIKLAGSGEYITTTLYPGWNVELVKAVKDAQPDTLQYGY